MKGLVSKLLIIGILTTFSNSCSTISLAQTKTLPHHKAEVIHNLIVRDDGYTARCYGRTHIGGGLLRPSGRWSPYTRTEEGQTIQISPPTYEIIQDNCSEQELAESSIYQTAE